MRAVIVVIICLAAAAGAAGQAAGGSTNRSAAAVTSQPVFLPPPDKVDLEKQVTDAQLDGEQSKSLVSSFLGAAWQLNQISCG